MMALPGLSVPCWEWIEEEETCVVGKGGDYCNPQMGSVKGLSPRLLRLKGKGWIWIQHLVSCTMGSQ